MARFSARTRRPSDRRRPCAGLRTARVVDDLAGTVLRVRLRGREPQHRRIARLHFHAPGMPARARDAVHARQVVAGHVEQQMMLEVVVHVVRRDEQPLEKIGARGARVAQGIVAVGHDGMLGDVADAGDHHHPGDQRHQPQQRIGPPHAGRRKAANMMALTTHCGPSFSQKFAARCASGQSRGPSALSSCALRCW